MGEDVTKATRGRRLRAIRQERGLTLAEIADRCSVTHAHLSMIERGRQAPGRRLLFDLARVLGVTPEYIETGRRSDDQRARDGRIAAWPELLYTLGNHACISRYLSGHSCDSGDEAVAAAIEKARDSLHMCEFIEWSRSETGKRIGERISAESALDEYIDLVADRASLDQACWLWLDGLVRLMRRVTEWERAARPRHTSHRSIMGSHSPAGARYPHELCFHSDLQTTLTLLAVTVQGTMGRELADSNVIAKSYLRDEFVHSAFNDVFWAVARLWSKRRLEGWLSYLAPMSDSWSLLRAGAVQSKTPTEFAKTARLAARDIPEAEREVFLACLPDLYVRSDFYSEKFDAMMLAIPAPGVSGSYSPTRFGLRDTVREHRRTRGQSRSQDALDAIFIRGSEQLRRRVEQYLHRLADENDLTKAMRPPALQSARDYRKLNPRPSPAGPEGDGRD